MVLQVLKISSNEEANRKMPYFSAYRGTMCVFGDFYENTLKFMIFTKSQNPENPQKWSKTDKNGHIFIDFSPTKRPITVFMLWDTFRNITVLVIFDPNGHF